MKTYLNVPFADKDIAKKHGARWDPSVKRWFVEDVANMADFMKWMPDHLKQPYVKSKASKHTKSKSHRDKPTMKIGRTITGENYYDAKCDCGIPPWENCEHSFRWVMDAEYEAMAQVAALL